MSSELDILISFLALNFPAVSLHAHIRTGMLRVREKTKCNHVWDTILCKYIIVNARNESID